MRLIDADAVLTEMENTFDMQGLYLPMHFMEFVIDEMPTVDPVKHGRWIEQEHGDWRFSKEFRCSECGMYRLVTTPAGWEWRYCPHCGAKMDEVSV